MTYTLWSRGRLLGHSELDYLSTLPRHRVGTLHPTALGTRLLSVAAGTSAAARAYGKALVEAQVADNTRNPGECAQEYADYVAAVDEAESLALELREPDGAVIPTEWIDVRDVAWLLSLAHEEPEPGEEPDDATWESEGMLDDGILDDVEWSPLADADIEDDTEPSGMQYQLQVMLLDDNSIARAQPL